MSHYEEIVQIMEKQGGAAYHGEPVSQLEHALQAAHLAAWQRSKPELVAAALLHDIGHMLHDEGEDAANRGVDTVHEDAGYHWLLSRFGAAVADPVRYHVAAKRYLCAVEPDYLEDLSPASLQSLDLQGGPFTEEECDEFERLPCFRDAVNLRRWDDAAKMRGMEVPGLESYRELLESLQLQALS